MLRATWRVGLLILILPLTVSSQPNSLPLNASIFKLLGSASTTAIEQAQDDRNWEATDVPTAYRTPAVRPAAAQSSLWERLRAGFRLQADFDHPKVQQEVRYLLRHGNLWQRRAARMEQYLPYILQQVEQLNMPAELALVPLVESGLDAYAFSPGGAAGLWQFIPATAERFDLQRNWWYDGRRDLVASTDAALAYFSFLYQTFDDWRLVMAGYNAGEGSVRRAKRKHRKSLAKGKGAAVNSNDGSGSVYWHLPLPAETKRYVPRVLAYAAIFSDPARYDVRLPEISTEITVQQVAIEGQFDLMQIAKTLEIDLTTLYHWNPSFSQWATPPEGPHRLLLPTSIADAQSKLAKVPADRRVNWRRHIIGKGETLGAIAKQYQTQVSVLKRANRLSSDNIRSGRALLVPTSTQAATEYPISRLQPTAEHKVVAGDSLWSLSRRYKVPISSLVKWNEIGPKEPLAIGKRLRVAPTSRRVVRKVHYAVRSGDSLSHIASRFKVPLAEITRWNRLDADAYLQPGQPLTLYVNVTGGQ